MLNYQRNTLGNTTFINNGTEYVIADIRPINFGRDLSTEKSTFPIFYACGFWDAIEAFEYKTGSGILPTVVLFKTEEEANEYCCGKVVSYTQFVAQNESTLEILLSRFGLKKYAEVKDVVITHNCPNCQVGFNYNDSSSTHQVNDNDEKTYCSYECSAAATLRIIKDRIEDQEALTILEISEMIDNT